MSFDGMVEARNAIDRESDLHDFTDPATLPTSGQVVYEGVLGIGPDATPEELAGSVVPEYLVGQFAMEVDFQDGTVDGHAGHFRTSEDEIYDGTLAISGGEIDRAVDPHGGGWTFEADLAGTLTHGDASLEIETELLGDFIGEDHRFAGGIIANGEIHGSDGTSFGVEMSPFDAER